MNSITLIDITKTFNNRKMVLNTLSGHFVQGQTYAITGSSGSGKTTLLNILAGIDYPSSGIIKFNGQPANYVQKNNSFLNTTMGLVFQQSHFIEELSVLQNVILPGLIKKQSYKKCIQKGQELLHAVGLSQMEDAFPKSLSGGQQQRLVLARALFNEPSFLLADEPTGNLDQVTTQNIMTLLLDCHKKWNMGLIISTHDSDVASHMNSIFEIKDGTLYTK
jgi:ABC-type lipoprotein export system ATPase subunit